MEECRWGFGFGKGDKELARYYADETVLTTGERLKDLLEERHISQKELAECTGLSEGTISNICNGDNLHKAKANTLATIAHYLDISVDWLLGLTQGNNMTRNEVVKQFAEKTGFSDKAILALEESIDYHNHGYDYEYGSVLGYILDKSYKDKKSFINWLELAKLEAYLYRNKENDGAEITWKNGKMILPEKEVIDFLIRKAVFKFEKLAREYIQMELKKPADEEKFDEEDSDKEDINYELMGKNGGES